MTIARNFFSVLLWKRVRLIVDGDYKNLGVEESFDDIFLS